jgi:hypothetical protein
LGFIGWLIDKLSGKPAPLSDITQYEAEYISLVGDIYIREMAFWSAVNIVANAVSKCEFKTFVNKKEIKGLEYYLWNVEPNRNQNSSVFLHKLIAQLYRKNECLVIEQNGQLLVADNFVRTPYALFDDKFTQVTVEDFTFQKTFYQAPLDRTGSRVRAVVREPAGRRGRAPGRACRPAAVTTCEADAGVPQNGA